MIHADPRFTRTSAVADMHLRIRTGTDVAYFGGLINYVLQNNLYHEEYVRVRDQRGPRGQGGLRVQRRAVQRLRRRQKRVYDTTAWAYETGAGRLRQGRHRRTLARCSTCMREHYSRYTPGDGRAHHRHPAGPVPRGGQARRRDGPAGQGDDDRVRGRPHPPHHRRAAHPLRRAAAAAAGQHGPARRRHERRARPRQHPGQHRPRDLLGHPARLPADPGAGPEEPRRLRGAEREQEAARRTR